MTELPDGQPAGNESSQSSAEAARTHARAIVDSYLERASHVWERADQFSTWLTGGSAAAVALLVANLVVARTNLGVWRVRLLLWILALSVFCGLVQKFFAFSAAIAAIFNDAGNAVLERHLPAVENARRSAGSDVTRQFDVPLLVTFIAEFQAAFPRVFAKRIAKQLAQLGSSERPSRRTFRAIVYQMLVTSAQLFILTIAVAIAASAA